MRWLNIRTGRRSIRLLVGTTVLLALLAGVTYAAIPGINGTINGCYEKRTGILRVIDAEAGKSCLSFETPIFWQQRGPAGATGPAGADGAQGPAGPPGPAGPAGAGFTRPVQVLGNFVSIPVDGTAASVATCPAGKVAVSGGWIVGTGVDITASSRDFLTEAWVVEGHNTNAFSSAVEAIVYCE